MSAQGKTSKTGSNLSLCIDSISLFVFFFSLSHKCTPRNDKAVSLIFISKKCFWLRLRTWKKYRKTGKTKKKKVKTERRNTLSSSFYDKDFLFETSHLKEYLRYKPFEKHTINFLNIVYVETYFNFCELIFIVLSCIVQNGSQYTQVDIYICTVINLN